MNNKRRKQITVITDKIQDLCADLLEAQNDEQEAYDNLPDNLVESEKGSNMLESLEIIEGAICEMESQLSELNEL